MARKPNDTQRTRSGDKDEREAPGKAAPERGRGADVPGHTPSRDADKDRTPATGPGGGHPEDNLRGTEASGHPGAVNSPYPGDDMNTDPDVAL
jgi:hypothetical protein